MAKDPIGYDNFYKPPVEGSVFVNNTSYGGCDIKVVIHIYDGGKAIQEWEERHLTAAQNASAQQSVVEGQITQTQQKLQEVHSGTAEDKRLRKQLAKLREQRGQLETSIPALQDKAKDLTRSKATSSTKVLAEAQTLSVSIYRDKQAVRACGSVYPKGRTRGPREIAGSIVFTVFDEHVMYEFLEAHASDFDGVNFSSVLLDQLPPVDILVSFANEYGQVSRMTLRGVEFSNEGQTMSVEDLITENVVNFVALDIDPMRAVSKRKTDQNSLLASQTQPKRASDLLLEEDYKALKDNMSPYERFSRRRNPFL